MEKRVSRGGFDLLLRNISIRDGTSPEGVQVTLWGERAETVSAASIGRVVSLLHATLGSSCGRPTIDITQVTAVAFDPDCEEAVEQKDWWAREQAAAVPPPMAAAAAVHAEVLEVDEDESKK